MEAIGTAIGLTKFILDWKEKRSDALQDMKGLTTSVCAVQQVLQALDSNKGGPHIQSALSALIDTLNEIKEIFQAYESRINRVKAFFFPATVSSRVRRAEGDMLKFVQILSLGVSLSPGVRGKEVEAAPQPTALEFIQSSSTRAFWKKNFGEKVFSIKSDVLVRALKTDYPECVDDKMLRDLVLRLDNFNTGTISVCRLADFVGDAELKKQLDAYKFNIERSSKESAASSSRKVDMDFTLDRERQLLTSSGSDGASIKLPLLVWVDDKPNVKELDYIKANGISLVQLKSTAEAKEWIKANDALLESVGGDRIKFVTNNVRQAAATSQDINAGEDICRFVRGRRFAHPILVFCGDLKYAQYVSQYDDVSAVNTSAGFRSFVDTLR